MSASGSAPSGPLVEPRDRLHFAGPFLCALRARRVGPRPIAMASFASPGPSFSPPSVPILKFCAFHPKALVLRRREAASKACPEVVEGDAPVRAGPSAAFWSILRDARLRLAPQDERVGSPRQSTFTVNRTNFGPGTLAARRQGRKSYCRSSARRRKRIGCLNAILGGLASL